MRIRPTAHAATLVASGTVIGLLLSHFASNRAGAGPLDPPAGPVAPSYKTLTEVEPRIAINATNTPGDSDSLFKITQPGSYYLTGNITGVAARHGIEIAAPGVTLDLMGFDLAGVAGSLDGVTTTGGNLVGLTIRNGSIRGWGDRGIDLITVPAINSTIVDIRASTNDRQGIAASLSTSITGCTATANGGTGISMADACSVTGCAAYLNTLQGISTGVGCSVTACSAYSNSGDGIVAGDGSTVSDCAVYDNQLHGIDASFGCTISTCTARSNGMSGINVLTGCTVTSCTVRTNSVDGILAAAGCLILANTCSANGLSGDGAGIHTTGADNRIEQNNCTSTTRGIDVDVAGNIIIRNTCSGNTTDWTIVANNLFGPIIDRRAAASGAVNGFAAATSLGSTDANANFSY